MRTSPLTSANSANPASARWRSTHARRRSTRTGSQRTRLRWQAAVVRCEAVGAGFPSRMRRFTRRRRTLITVAGSVLTATILGLLLAGRRDEFGDALSSAALWVLGVTVLLQIVALLARSEAWHLTIRSAGGTVDRRVLYRASSMGVLGSLVNGQMAVAARIAALRRSCPDVSPRVPTLIAAEFPILAVEAALAALTSFTLVGPLGLPWWMPLIGLGVIGAASVGLRRLALWTG